MSSAPLGSCAKRASIVAAPRIAGMDSKKEYLTSCSLSTPVNIPVATVDYFSVCLKILRSLAPLRSISRQPPQLFVAGFQNGGYQNEYSHGYEADGIENGS
jgi:hypothetical protein